MANRIVILHGWSASSNDFEPLAKHLEAALEREVVTISLGDYLSMEDEIRFDDLASAMKKAWDHHGLPTDKRSVDAVVHSAGGLVIRQWLNRYFDPDQAPVHRMVMLAPANFGSPLAHKGRSFAARVFKGFIAKKPEGNPFETGTQILKGLELASSYTWELAQRDRFGDGGRMYDQRNVLCTVLVGNNGYTGIRAIGNEDGSDGTVRISTANMNCVRMTAMFPAHPENPNVGRDWRSVEESSGTAAFGIVDGHNHSSIKLSKSNVKSKRDRDLLTDIVRGLTVEDDGFHKWCELLARRNEALLPNRPSGNARKHGFQNTVVHVEDQYGVGVEDYLLEFYEKDNDKTAERFHGTVIGGVHKYSDDPSYRSVYVDCTRLTSAIDKVGEYLRMSVTAHPEINPPYTYVGFETLADDGIGAIHIKKDEISKFFTPHRTALVTLQLERQQSDRVFRFDPYPKP